MRGRRFSECEVQMTVPDFSAFRPLTLNSQELLFRVRVLLHQFSYLQLSSFLIGSFWTCLPGRVSSANTPLRWPRLPLIAELGAGKSYHIWVLTTPTMQTNVADVLLVFAEPPEPVSVPVLAPWTLLILVVTLGWIGMVGLGRHSKTPF